MAPVEKYKPGSGGDQGKVDAPVDAALSPEKQASLQKELTEFRSNLRERYSKRKKEVISSALRDAKEGDEEKDEEFSDKAAKKMARQHHRERVKNFREALKDQKEMTAVEFAYAEITDFDFNQETFRGEGGWLQEFKDSDAKDKGTLEEFVLQKQYAELTAIRETLLEVRVGDKVLDLYPELEGEDNKKDRTKKSKEIAKDSKDFFQTNSVDIEKYLLAKPADRIELRKKLFEKFKSGVFADIKESDSKANVIINTLFNELVDDYEAMMSAKEKAKLLNPKMVQLLMKEGLTKDQWEEELAIEAEQQAKKLAERQKVIQQEQIVSAAPPAKFDGGPYYYNGPISVDEKMGTNAAVTFEQVGPGEYVVRFPTEGLNGVAESRFIVKEVREGDKTFKVFIFKDPLMDRPAIIREGLFKAQINGLYLEKVMSHKDFLGPGLNNIIHDQEMFAMAEKFFTPKKLNEVALTKVEAENFRKIMLLLISTGNNQPGEGIYGDMLAIRNRISLLRLTLDNPAHATALRNFLEKASPESLQKLSIEKVCKQIGVAPNYGNFTKT